MSEIDLSAIGSDSFPNNVNDVMDLVETIARQNIRAVKSANRLDDAVYRYEVDHGKVIQEALIAKAASYAFDKDAYSRAPSDPTVYAKYFDNYGARQFETTTRVNDIRKIIADKGVGVEDVVSEIISTLTTGDGYEDFIAVRNLLFNQYIPDYTSILGGVPKNIRGAIYAARDMYNHLLNDNDDLTAGAGTDDAFVSSTPREDIRVAMTDKMLNLMDVAELAHVFNLSKEELFGKLVIVPADAGNEADWYKIVVYDRKAMGRATRLFEFTQEEVARGLYFNHYLTTDRAYFFNDLFKSAIIDCSVAAQSALDDLVVAPFDITVNVINGTSEGDDAILLGRQAQVTLAASEGYVLPQSITVTGADFTYNATTGVVVLSNPTDDIAITCNCLEVFSITSSVSNGSATGDSQIIENGTASVTLSAASGYALPSSISVSGASFEYNSTTGIVSLSNPTDDVVITCVCLAIYSITVTVSDGDSDGDSEIVQGGTASVTLSADSGYHLPASITVSGATHTYDSTTGVVSLSAPTGNVSIACVCEQDLVFSPLAVGDDISGGEKLYADVNANMTTVIAAMIAALDTMDYATYDSSLRIMAKGGSGEPQICFNNSYGDESIQYMWGVNKRQYIWRKATGWNSNIGADGSLVLDGDGSGTISAIQGSGWNGVAIGLMKPPAQS